MAVIVRSEGRDEALRRILMAHGVPMLPSASESPVRDEVAVRPLLALVDTVLKVALDPDHRVEPERAIDLVLSPLGECDAVGLRRLRRLLRREELENGGERSSDELLAAVLLEPGHAASLGHDAAPVRRLSQAIDAGLDVARTVSTHGEAGDTDGARTWAPGVSAETVLWAVWDALDVAGRWNRLALRGGKRGARADRDLDAVVGLFDAAQRYVDRLPAAGPDAFLEHIQGQDVPGDTLAARAQSGDGVALVTPAGPPVASGATSRSPVSRRVSGPTCGCAVRCWVRRSWSRSSPAATGPSGRRRRRFVTTRRGCSSSRCRARRSGCWSAPCAVRTTSRRSISTWSTPWWRRRTRPGFRSRHRRSSGSSPSSGAPSPSRPSWPTSAAGWCWTTRRGRRPRPRRWAAWPRCTWPAPILGSGGSSASSATTGRCGAPSSRCGSRPSKVESFGDCRLRWALTSAGGDAPSQGSANLGTLIHDIAHELGDDADAETLVAEVERRWGRLGLPPGWATDRQREQAHQMAYRLAAYFADPTRPEKVDSEVPLRIDVGRATISGRVDRLEREPDGGLRVVDYKTGSSKPKAQDVATHPQLGTYQLAVEHGAFGSEGQTSAGAALLHLGKAAGTTGKPALQQQPPLDTQDDPAWAAALVAETADGMGGGEFAATPGSWCTFCPVKTSCPAMPEGSTLR